MSSDGNVPSRRSILALGDNLTDLIYPEKLQLVSYYLGFPVLQFCRAASIIDGGRRGYGL